MMTFSPSQEERQEIEDYAKRRGISFQQAFNELLRLGLDHAEQEQKRNEH